MFSNCFFSCSQFKPFLICTHLNIYNPITDDIYTFPIPEDHGRACSTFSIMAGIGGSLGYALGGFNWDNTVFGDFLGGSIKTVFTLVAVIFVVGLVLTVTSFREIPLPLMEKDELLRPLTESIIKKERAKLDDKIYYIKDVSRAFALQLHTIDEKAQPPAPLMISNALAAEAEKGHQLEACSSSDSDSEDESEKAMSLKDFLKSIFMMPKSIAILCFTNLLCWMGHLSFCLYFTDFVGEEVFGGNPAAPSSSESYQLYLEGVRYGCFGLAIYSLACSCYSFTIEKLIKILRARIVYCGGLMIDAVGMIMMAMFPNKVTVFVFSASGGIVYALLFTMPFLLLGQYHAKGQVSCHIVAFVRLFLTCVFIISVQSTQVLGVGQTGKETRSGHRYCRCRWNDFRGADNRLVGHRIAD